MTNGRKEPIFLSNFWGAVYISSVLLFSFEVISYLFSLSNIFQLILYLLNSIPNTSDNTVIDAPIIKRLKVLLGFNTTEKKPVPIGIKRIATVNIIPNTLPKNSLSTSL